MKICAIYQKEWLKLKKYTLVFSTISMVIGVYFWFHLTGIYANIEPESMMWYRFSHLGNKPYSWLIYCFALSGVLTAICQFVPEVFGKKIRILTHLPVSLNRVVLKHLVAGCLMLLFVNIPLVLIVVSSFVWYYPVDIVHICIKDMLFGQMSAIAIYLGLAAVIVESDWRRKVLKFVLAALLALILLKEKYQLQDLLWLILLFWLILPVKDSFLSVKTRRLENKFYLLSIPLFALLMMVTGGMRLYSEFALSHTKYYVFYSSILNDFVYQQNGSGHQFNYGTLSSALTKTEFEESLPFVYWKNLDIQGKLPVMVKGQSYGKNQIRASRMSLQYEPSRLAKPEVDLYPLFNPISHNGSIPFPEDMFALKQNRVEVYASETAKPNTELAQRVNDLLVEKDVHFPVKSVWGKTTNMKPFDWGYFIQDAEDRIFNLRRADDVVQLYSVNIPENVGRLVFMQVSENRQKKFYGYAIDEKNHVYLISYPDYQFIPLELNNFDYKTMSFQLLSDPVNYLVRFDNGKQYHAVLFSKDYKKLNSITLN